jgi:pantetheine-phosphate adenylyltransferase
MDIIERGARIFDKLIVAIAQNSRKTSLFDVDERMEMIEQSVSHFPRVTVDAFEGLTVMYAISKNACAILRGLRAVADFEYELQMANMNRKISANIETMFMMTSDKCFFVSSQNVKEVARLGGDVQELVPPEVMKKIKVKFGS